MFIAVLDLAGIGAIVLAAGGIVSAYLSIRRAKREGSIQCHELLNKSRLEAESYARVLHDIRMSHPELIPEDAPEPRRLRNVKGDKGLAGFYAVLSAGLFTGAAALGMWALGPSPSTKTGPIGPRGPQGIQGP